MAAACTSPQLIGSDCLYTIAPSTEGLAALSRCSKPLSEVLQPGLNDQREREVLEVCGRLGFDATSREECAQRKNDSTDIARLLRVSLTHVRLHCEEMRISDDGAMAIGRALSANPWTLQFLSLWDNYIGPPGAASLASALRTHVGLKELRLSYNSLGEEGAICIAEALEENAVLTSLDMRGTGMGCRGASAIAAALLRNTTLLSLDLRSNCIECEGGAAIAKALAVNAVIEHVSLMHHSRLGESAQLLRAAAARRASLEVEL